jgi:hypothetical protein
MIEASTAHADDLVQIALARDEATAERWLAALTAQGIEGALRIEDGTHLAAAGSVFSGQTFVYPLLVPRSKRAAAASVLVDLGRSGPFWRRRTDASSTWRGAVVAAAAAVGLAIVLALRGG